MMYGKCRFLSRNFFILEGDILINKIYLPNTRAISSYT